MTQQYKHDSSAPKIIPNVQDKQDKDAIKLVRDLTAKLEEQDRLITRMHRDIVRLKADVSALSARIK